MAFRDLGVKTKVLLLAAVLSMALVLVGAMGVYVIGELKEELGQLCNNQLQQVRILSAARAYTRGVEANMLQVLLQDTEPGARAGILKETGEYAETLLASLNQLEKTDLHTVDPSKLNTVKQEIGIAAH